MDGVIRWLVDRRPSSPAPTLVHNDYKLDNVMFGAESEDGAESACRIEAIRWPILD
jgi:aminoglycoside phosphotransferase (APT) family kinase protein